MTESPELTSLVHDLQPELGGSIIAQEPARITCAYSGYLLQFFFPSTPTRRLCIDALIPEPDAADSTESPASQNSRSIRVARMSTIARGKRLARLTEQHILPGAIARRDQIRENPTLWTELWQHEQQAMQTLATLCDTITRTLNLAPDGWTETIDPFAWHIALTHDVLLTIGWDNVPPGEQFLATIWSVTTRRSTTTRSLAHRPHDGLVRSIQKAMTTVSMPPRQAADDSYSPSPVSSAYPVEEWIMEQGWMRPATSREGLQEDLSQTLTLDQRLQMAGYALMPADLGHLHVYIHETHPLSWVVRHHVAQATFLTHCRTYADFIAAINSLRYVDVTCSRPANVEGDVDEY